MIRLTLALVFLSAALFADTPESSSTLKDLKSYDFSIRMDIRYATANNFMKAKLYPEAKCFLQRPALEALSRVQTSLKLVGLGLKVYDCYRPLSIQKKMWEKVHDPRYVADPKEGSRHNRGAAVDLTLVDRAGNELEMPSGYDDFSPKAHRDYKGGTEAARKNRQRLEEAMAKEGFVGLPTEWWHFDYRDWQKYPLLDIPYARLK